MKKFYSTPRLNSYSQILGVSEALAPYAHHWNTALCSSLYPALQAFELTLRNSINNAAYKSIRSPYKNNNWWFETVSAEVQDRKIRQMRTGTRRKWVDNQGNRKPFKLGYFEKNIASARQLLGDQRRQINASAVLSRQSFGFWVGMLGSDFEARNSTRFLWPHLLSDVFPNAPIHINLVVLRERANQIKDLRNRISHHEPIWKFFNVGTNNLPDYSNPVIGLRPSLKILRKHYDSILEYIEWMSHDAYKELISSGLCHEFEFLCSVDGFEFFLENARRSAFQKRIDTDISRIGRSQN